jgi:hypothetical protein
MVVFDAFMLNILILLLDQIIFSHGEAHQVEWWLIDVESDNQGPVESI